MLLLWDGNVKEGMHQLWKSVKLSSPFLHWSALYLEENSQKPNSSVLKVFVKNFSTEANEALNLQFKKFNLPSWPSVHWTPHLLFLSQTQKSSEAHFLKRGMKALLLTMSSVSKNQNDKYRQKIWNFKRIFPGWTSCDCTKVLDWKRWFEKDWLGMQFRAILDRSSKIQLHSIEIDQSPSVTKYVCFCTQSSISYPQL